MPFDSRNASPSPYGGRGLYNGEAYNNITNRPGEIIETMPPQKPSKNMAEASLKVLRLYRKACRMMPFILRIHNIAARVTVVQAMANLADYFKEKSFMRDPRLVDCQVTRGYERLFEAIQHHTHTPYIFKFICPDNHINNHQGYSYLTEKKYGGKTKFLKDFYHGKGPYY